MNDVTFDKTKPSFGGSRSTTPTNTGETPVAENKRTSVGAIWERTSQYKTRYMTMQVQFTKERLKALLDQPGETVDLSLVAFINKYKENNEKRPDFKIYEDVDRK